MGVKKNAELNRWSRGGPRLLQMQESIEILYTELEKKIKIRILHGFLSLQIASPPTAPRRSMGDQ